MLLLLMIPLLPGAEGGGSDGGFALGAGHRAGQAGGLVVAVTVLIERVAMRRIFQASTFTGARELLALSAAHRVARHDRRLLGARPVTRTRRLHRRHRDGRRDLRTAGAQRDRPDPHGAGRRLLRVRGDARGRAVDARARRARRCSSCVPLVAGKAIVTFAAATIARVPRTAAILSAAALAQLGEFSFAVLTTGADRGPGRRATRSGCSCPCRWSRCIVTPWLIAARAGSSSGARWRPATAWTSTTATWSTRMSGHAIVIGAGPAGRAVVTSRSPARTCRSW